MKSQLYSLYTLLPTIIADQFWLAASPGNCHVSSVPAVERYSGTKYNTGMQTRLRIANGGGMHLITYPGLVTNLVAWQMTCTAAF
jgi:hypothetical protein